MSKKSKTRVAKQEAEPVQTMRESALSVDMRAIGSSGLRRSGGHIYEERLPELTGVRGMQAIRDMCVNDATCGTVLYNIDKLVRRVPWTVVRASDSEFDRDAARFVEECQQDMEMAWTEIISEIMTMLPYGFSAHEILYKRRAGQGSEDPTLFSKYSDGRIGWRGMPMRGQDTIYQWHFDEAGNVVAITQQAPPLFRLVTIPMKKILHFRTSVDRNNPEGRSIFRHVYRASYIKRHIENVEAVGVERDAVGLPVAHVPPELMLPTATDGQKAQLEAIKKMVTQIRRDEQEGIVMPLAYDENGREMYRLDLLSSGGARQFQTDTVIQRYDTIIARGSLSDFMMLGAGATAQGSWAMHSDKTKMFAASIGAFLDIIAEVMNRHAIPRLMALNDFQMSDYPRLEHAGIESKDLREVGAYVQQLAAAGMPMFPDDQLENSLREVANLPPIPVGSAAADQEIEPQEAAGGEAVDEITDGTPSNAIPDPLENAETGIQGSRR